ncbi:uncharacterized protein LOC123918543 isoform X2 [Trifolium pratense]|uniref:uncharacterized protein LOC123918543 isoform X2 n=1 Tax=Trifolium pratense TaxID=57577 RepID=UPI001E69389D|nr:uncharacterized protein LOC123918543 isoform X2 [Trifolium pratense]
MKINNKTQNVRCGAKKQRHTNKLFGVFSGGAGAVKFLKKSKKREKVRSLSAVSNITTPISQMGCHVSEKQQQQHTKRFKIPNNFMNGCYGASVPRKLRSAMKKRGRESILLDTEKVNHKINEIESPEKDNVKKSKVIIKQEISQNWSQREVSASITKDEEEVAETLYTMAAMFPHSDSISKKLDGESLIVNSSVLRDMKENANATLEASVIGQGASLCPESCLTGEASKITSLNETVISQEPSETAKLLGESHGITPTIHLRTKAETVNRECRNKVALHDSELCLAMGLNITGQSQISRCDPFTFQARNVDSKQKHHLIKEHIKNESLALWPDLSSVSSAVSHIRLRKRCATHVYISHTIRSIESAKQGVIKESKLLECRETRAPEGSKRGVPLEVHNLNGVASATVKNPSESKNSILLQQCHYDERSHAAPTSGAYGPQKQSFNFLSLSTGNNGLSVQSNNYNKVGSRMEPLSNLQVPYFQSPAHQQRVVPIPTHQSRYASTVYLDQLTVVGPQLRLQQPHYYGNQLCGTQYSSTSNTGKQKHQNFWGMQEAAQGSSLNCNIMMRTQNPIWQSGRNDSSAMGPCAQAIFTNNPVSQEIFGSNITSISGRQLQLISPIQNKWARSSSQFYM